MGIAPPPSRLSHPPPQSSAAQPSAAQPGQAASPQSGKWADGVTFVNTWSGLRMVFPAGYTNEAYDPGREGWIHDFSICSPGGDIMFQAVYRDMGKAADFGNNSYQKATFTMADSLTRDVYMRPVGNHIMILEALYCKGREDTVDRILEAK